MTARILIFSKLLIVALMATCFAGETPVLFNPNQDRAYFLAPDEGPLSEMVEPEAPLKYQSGQLRVCQLNNSQGDAFKDSEDFEDTNLIPDPIEPLNRIIFQFNDDLYFGLLKPIAIVYTHVIPETLRIRVRNFFSNLAMPIRAVNCVLQGDINGFGTEIARFFINSTVGMLGLWDPAKDGLKLKSQDEDLGQTLGFLGVGPGIYIVWPILGPSSIRGTVGLVGDFFLDPLNYIFDETKYNIAVRGYQIVNETSLTIGDYESLKKAALDPYIAFRDAYYQYRQKKIKE